VVFGTAFAGRMPGWNLGHSGFASNGRSTIYMGIHVALTGVCGLLAPRAGSACTRDWNICRLAPDASCYCRGRADAIDDHHVRAAGARLAARVLKTYLQANPNKSRRRYA